MLDSKGGIEGAVHAVRGAWERADEDAVAATDRNNSEAAGDPGTGELLHTVNATGDSDSGSVSGSVAGSDSDNSDLEGQNLRGQNSGSGLNMEGRGASRPPPRRRGALRAPKIVLR